MIKAVFFDMGGVIVSLDAEKCYNAFRQDVGFEDIGDYVNEFRQNGFVGMFEEGGIGEDEFYEEALKHCRPGATREDIIACFKAFLPELNTDILNFIRELKDRGYTLFILSNNNPICSRIVEDMMTEKGFPPHDYFTKIFYSHEMRMVKPGAEIFKTAIRESGFDISEIVFIDDVEKNIAGAKAVGMTTIKYQMGMDIRKEFKKYESNQ